MHGYIVLARLGARHAHGKNASLHGDVSTLKEVYQRMWGRCKIDMTMHYYSTYATSRSVLIPMIDMVLVEIHHIFKVMSRHLTVQYRLT